MANTFTCLRYHVVFSTKRREPWIRPDLQERLWAYLGGIAKQNGMKALLGGGMPEHVHCLLGLPPTLPVSEALKLIKGGSSGWVRENLPGCRGFGWQDGYAALSVSQSQGGGGGGVHPHPAGTPPGQDVSGGIQGFVGTTRHRI